MESEPTIALQQLDNLRFCLGKAKRTGMFGAKADLWWVREAIKELDRVTDEAVEQHARALRLQAEVRAHQTELRLAALERAARQSETAQ